MVAEEPVVAAARELTAPLDFEDWAAAEGAGLMRFALVVTGRRDDAADAVQDALVAVYVRWRRLIATGAPDAYARRVIVNRRISWWRRIGRREQPLPADDPAAPAFEVSDVVLAERLLTSLPTTQRAAVALRYLDDRSFAEIGEILGCPETTARSHVHRALKHLRAQLGEDDD